MSRPTQRRARARGSLAGYTLIEVIMAIGVLTAGAVGIMALQQAATRGNMAAREMTTGSQLAQRWVERLRRDGLNWVASSTTVPVSPLILSNTDYLQNVPAAGDAPTWFVPVPDVSSGESATFDFYGNDTTTDSEMHYCTNVRLEWLYPGRTMRADVRVWWLRTVTGAQVSSDRADLVACGPTVDPNDLTGDFRVRMAYASTVIRYVARRN